MKKLLTLLAALVLVSCTAKEPPVPSEFDASISISANGTQYEAVYEKRLDSDRIVFSLPERLQGLDLSLKDGVCTVTMGDVSFESENYKAVFDFLPVDGECEKTAGQRIYKIYDLRDVK